MISFWSRGSQLFTPVAIVQSDSTTFGTKPLKAIIILTADAATPDTIKITDIEDNDITITLPVRAAGSAYPILLPVGARKVWATGTSLEDVEMLGLR